MKRSLLIAAILPLALLGQQTPWLPADDFYSSGAQQVYAPFELHSPLLSSNAGAANSAQIDYLAGQRVMLRPGFQAGNFSGNGYFRAQIGSEADFEVGFLQPNEHLPNVGIHEKLEIGINLPAALQQQVDQWITSQYTSGINPFDPEQISVEAVISNGISSYLVYGFYYKEFIRDPLAIGQPFTSDPVIPANWIPQPTAYEWRIRFAPPEIGYWISTISIRLNNATSVSYSVNNLRFRCVGSANEGWLEKGANDWYLRYSGTHNSFFALGENIAWNDKVAFYGNYPGGNSGFFNLYEGGYMDILDWTENLADNGGNMVRLVSRPRSFDIEWEHLNNYYEGMNRAWELDQMFELCEEKNMKIFFCMEYHPKYGVQSDEAEWSLNPYNIELPAIDHPDDFLADAQAKKKFKAKLRYYFARWGYSTSLGVFELLSEMDGWSYESGSELRNDAPSQLLQLNWHNEMLAYIIALSAYRPILTSSSYGGAAGRDFHYPIFDSEVVDITTFHAYKSERNTNKIRFDEFNKNVPLLKGTHAIWDHKPTIFDEMGLKIPNAIPDHNDIEGCSDVSYHNALWATAFMGGLGTGFNWWQWFNNGYRETNYPALNIFFSGIDFEHSEYKKPDFWDDAPIFNSSHSESTIEVFYNRSDNKDNAMGWVHNSTFWYGNTDEYCPDRNGVTVAGTSGIPLNDDMAYTDPIALNTNTKFEIRGLNNLASYAFQWYFTRIPGGVDATDVLTTNIFGTLKPIFRTGQPDWAFKAFRPGNNFRLYLAQNDTLRCDEDTVYASGNHELDTLGQFSYHWNFGNGFVSSERNTIAIYSIPGAYLVTLIVSDSLGFSDTLRQTIVKPACGNSRHEINEYVSPTNGLTVYPNPVRNALFILTDTSWGDMVTLKIYTLDGIVIYSEDNSSFFVDMSTFEAGCYFISIRDSKHEEILKIVHVH